MSVRASLLLLALSSLSLLVAAEEKPSPEGFEYCTVCHGSQLKGNPNIGAPRLSGLAPWYVERQLLNFKQGIRGTHSDDERGREMRPMVINLSDDEISAISAWVAKTVSATPHTTITGDSTAGRNLYQSCAACHGTQAQGNQAIGAPALRGLNDWYLVTQLNHFRLNVRGNLSTDVYGQQMKAVRNIVTSDQDAADLAAYISQLN